MLLFLSEHTVFYREFSTVIYWYFSTVTYSWISYTNNLPELMEAINNSMMVVSAWSEEKLVGLIRVIGDKTIILYIQDILVLKEYKRRGVGRTLIEKVIESYKNIRQIVLLTDESDESRGFYESLGFKSCDDGRLVAYARMK